MLFTPAAIEGIRAGTITFAFRRWDRPRVKPGSRIKNSRGVVEIVSVTKVGRISEADARRAGFETAAKLLALVDKKSRGGDLYKVGVQFGGEDPRKALRQNADLSDEDLQYLRKRLDRMDANVVWTRAVLRLIGDRPEVVSTELAAEVVEQVGGGITADDPRNVMIHGIRPEQVARAPRFAEVFAFTTDRTAIGPLQPAHAAATAATGWMAEAEGSK